MLTWGKGWGNRELVLDGATVGYFETGTFRERVTVVLGPETWEFERGRAVPSWAPARWVRRRSTGCGPRRRRSGRSRGTS